MDKMKNGFVDVLAEVDSEILIADGFDDAIIGYVERFDGAYALYDKAKVIDILKKDMSEEEAIEYYAYNIIGAYMGEHTPAFATILSKEGLECT